MKAKQHRYILGMLLLSMTFTACNFLDYNEATEYTEDYQFSVFIRTKAFLNNIYSHLPGGFNDVDGAMREAATDNAEHVWDLSGIQRFNDGSWSAIATIDDQWRNMYLGIRKVNLFLKNVEGQTFPETQYNQDYIAEMEQFAMYPYEARFLRAFFYFELIKRYGDVPLVTTVLTAEEANEVEPVAFDSIVRFIVEECDSTAQKLPTSFADFSTTKETGRATKKAAMALKARTLLYAASPLHNPENDIEKWIEAAKASKAIYDQFRSELTPLPAYTDIVNSLSSKELIFERREAIGNSFEYANTAIGFDGGSTGICPSQNLVDAYEMKSNGLGINEPGSGYDPANPYLGRDPRLSATILHHGTLWKTQVVEVWNGGKNAPPKANATKTGYYLKKYMLESISLDPVSPTRGQHYWVLFRYAEVLLNYAEAMNEIYGPNVGGAAPLDMPARAAVNTVRSRTGVAMPAIPTSLTQDQFREKLRNERRVELAFEDHRFWDIRRWKIGDKTTEIRGMEVTRIVLNDQVTYTYTPKVVEQRVWDDKMNLYPIPQTEYYINPKLGQNKGW